MATLSIWSLETTAVDCFLIEARTAAMPVSIPRFSAIGAAPALLTLLVRWKLKDPEQAVKARERAGQAGGEQTGRLVELFQGAHLRNTLVGVGLAVVAYYKKKEKSKESK